MSKSVFGDVLSATGKVASTAASGVYLAGKAAVNGANNLYDTIKDDKEAYDIAKKKNEENKSKLENSQQEYADSYNILSYEAKQLDNLIKRLQIEIHKLTDYYEMDTRKVNVAKHNIAKADSSNIVSTSFGGALASGTLAAGSVAGLVASFGTAGTGAAISSLSGTYATNAILAWLGGGTIASGGAGIAGGIAVASALFAIPAIAVGGFVAHGKVQEFCKQVEEATYAVSDAVKGNKHLTIRNYEAAKRIRRVSEVGIAIMFFLVDLNYRKKFVAHDKQGKMNQICVTARDKLYDTFMKLKPLDDSSNGVIQIIEQIKEIEGDCHELQNIVGYEDIELYSSRDIIEIYHRMLSEAKECIWLSYPWFNMYCVKNDLKYLQKALSRGVKITIYWGIGNNDSGYDNSRYEKSRQAIQWLKEHLDSKNLKVYPSDSHRKIALCEKYVLFGSQNIMSYRYSENRDDMREELTAKLDGNRNVEKFKLVLKTSQIQND